MTYLAVVFNPALKPAWTTHIMRQAYYLHHQSKRDLEKQHLFTDIFTYIKRAFLFSFQTVD